MESMIERVAAALCVAQEYDWDNLDYMDPRQDEFIDYARAAVAAMREPDEAMLDGYWHAAGESKEMRPRTHASGRRYYQSMIDAVLVQP